MRKNILFGFALFLFALSFYAGNISAQDNKNNKDEDRLKQQPEILINADLEKVSAVIIKGMTEDKYDLEKENNHQLVFRKRIGGATGFMAGMLAGRDAENPHQIITFVMVKEGDGTLVSARAATLYPNKNNEGIPRSVDNKKSEKSFGGIWTRLKNWRRRSKKKLPPRAAKTQLNKIEIFGAF